MDLILQPIKSVDAERLVTTSTDLGDDSSYVEITRTRQEFTADCGDGKAVTLLQRNALVVVWGIGRRTRALGTFLEQIKDINESNSSRGNDDIGRGKVAMLDPQTVQVRHGANKLSLPFAVLPRLWVGPRCTPPRACPEPTRIR